MDSGCVDFADLLVRCMSTCPRRKLLIKTGFSRPNSSRPPLYHQTRPHPVPPRTAVNEPFRVVVVVVVCSAAPDMPTWHACRTSTHPTGERMTTTTTGEKAEREGARVHNTRTHSFDPIRSIPSLLLRKASQEESKVVWTTTSPSSPTKPNQTQPSDCDPNRRDWFAAAAGLRGGRVAVTLWGRGAGRSTFFWQRLWPGGLSPLAQMVNPPPPWLAACHVSFVGSGIGPVD